jgi:hypothetical protein
MARNRRILAAPNDRDWHLFLVQDGVKSMLISAESGCIEKAEELVVAAANDECDMDFHTINARYLGIAADGDICEEI